MIFSDLINEILGRVEALFTAILAVGENFLLAILEVFDIFGLPG